MNGLVLAGGRSARMGRDKASLVYPAVSDLPVAVHLYRLLSNVCNSVLLSLRIGQQGFPGINRVDDPGSLGPAGGLLAAHGLDPNASWLVVACDFPFVSEAALRELANRGGAYLTNEGVLDPLLALWTPLMLEALRDEVAHGHTSPRKTLERLGVPAARCAWPEQMRNINTALEAAGLAV